MNIMPSDCLYLKMNMRSADWLSIHLGIWISHLLCVQMHIWTSDWFFFYAGVHWIVDWSSSNENIWTQVGCLLRAIFFSYKLHNNELFVVNFSQPYIILSLKQFETKSCIVTLYLIPTDYQT